MVFPNFAFSFLWFPYNCFEILNFQGGDGPMPPASTNDAYVVPLCSKRGDEVARALESIFEQDSYGKIQTNRGSKFVNTQIKKVLLKYNTILYQSHSPIKVALDERLIGTI
jgi:hypothetical protein